MRFLVQIRASTRRVPAAVALSCMACSSSQGAPGQLTATAGAAAVSQPHMDASADAAGSVAANVVRARGSLVASDSWQVMTEATDPFADRPSGAACPDGTYMPELLATEPVFSVDTGGCHYITARQASVRNVAAGETLVLRVWHFALDADEPAVAHVAVQLGAAMLIDTSVPIPAPGGLLHVEQVVAAPIPQGTAIYFHLHNHGDNSWSFVELSAGPS